MTVVPSAFGLFISHFQGVPFLICFQCMYSKVYDMKVVAIIVILEKYKHEF